MDAGTTEDRNKGGKVITSRQDDEIQRSISDGFQSLLPHWDFQFSAPCAHKNFHGFSNPHPETNPTELKLVRREHSGPIDLEKHKETLTKLLDDLTERLSANSKSSVKPEYNVAESGNEITVTPVLVNRFETGNSEPKLLPDKDAQIVLAECRNEIGSMKLHDAIDTGATIFDKVSIKINPANAKECNLDLAFKSGIEGDAVQEARALAEAIGIGFGGVEIKDCRQTENNNILVVMNAGSPWSAEKLQKYVAVHLEGQISVDHQPAAVRR